MAGKIVVSTINDSSGVLATQNGMTGIAKAWVNFNGTGTVAIRDSFNVSSITDNGTGTYTINFTTAMPNANYNVSGAGNFTASTNNVSLSIMPLVYNTNSIQVNTCTYLGQIDSLFVNVSIFSS